jgi:hypothetical protein
VAKESFATVKPDESMSRVQKAVTTFKECTDAFVTENGTDKTPVLRWITDIDVAKIEKT